MLELDNLQKFISEHAFYDSMARFPPPRCYPETRVEVLKIITDWIDDADPRKRIFWLNSPAGAGKTAIAQTIAERCKGTQLAASFFFQRKTSDRGVADRLFLTLAWQLAISIPEIRPYFESTLKAERSIHAKSIDVQFDLLFVQVFEKLLREKPDLRPQKSLVIIDAIDECATDQDQEMILELIRAKMPNRAPLRVLISSRPEPHIAETIDTSITCALVLDQKVTPDNDIQRYLGGEFCRIFKERGTPPPPSIADIINRLVLISSGQFIYASTVVKFVDDRDHHPKKQLDIVLGTRRSSSSPFAQLDQLYIQILSQQQNIWLLRGVFALILAFGQIDLDRTCRFLWIEKEDLKLKLRRMHSLLHVSDSGIKPYHLSLLNFLDDKKRAGKYYVHPFWVVLADSTFDIPDFLVALRAGTIVLLVIADLNVVAQLATVITVLLLHMSFIAIFMDWEVWIRRKRKHAVMRGLAVFSIIVLFIYSPFSVLYALCIL